MGYFTQLNKERVVSYTADKETALVNHAISNCGDETMMTFSEHTIDIHTMTRRRFLHLPDPNPGKALPFPMGLGHWSP